MLLLQRLKLRRNQSSAPSLVLEGAWMGSLLKIWMRHPPRLQSDKLMQPTVFSPQQLPHHSARCHVRPPESLSLALVEASHQKEQKRFVFCNMHLVMAPY